MTGPGDAIAEVASGAENLGGMKSGAFDALAGSGSG
jgi:hypothetical protein